jgi:hypothetical protein
LHLIRVAKVAVPSEHENPQELEEAAARVQQEVTAAFEEAERELELMRHEGEAEEMAAE